MLTTEAILLEIKDVTRRLGWWFLKPGDVLWAIEKGQGLKKGEKVRRLKKIRVKSVRREPLKDMPQGDLVREGFPHFTKKSFIKFFCASHKGCTPETFVNRIEFEYLPCVTHHVTE